MVYVSSASCPEGLRKTSSIPAPGEQRTRLRFQTAPSRSKPLRQFGDKASSGRKHIFIFIVTIQSTSWPPRMDDTHRCPHRCARHTASPLSCFACHPVREFSLRSCTVPPCCLLLERKKTAVDAQRFYFRFVTTEQSSHAGNALSVTSVPLCSTELSSKTSLLNARFLGFIHSWPRRMDLLLRVPVTFRIIRDAIVYYSDLVMLATSLTHYADRTTSVLCSSSIFLLLASWPL